MVFRNLESIPVIALRWGLVAALSVLTACGPQRRDFRLKAGPELSRYMVGTLWPGLSVDSVLTPADDDSWLVPLDAPWGLEVEWSNATADAQVDEDEVALLLARKYELDPPFPAALAELEALRAPVMTVAVDGSMTPYRREVRLSVQDVRQALESRMRGHGLRYPVGTLMIGEHQSDGRIVETTVMRRRADGYWDFGAYDAQGKRTSAIEGEPDPLQAPADCFGCHYGSREFEPERSFPGRAADGPRGPRVIHLPDSWRNPVVSRSLDEHRRREDGVLGPYATIWVSALLAGADSLATGQGDRDIVAALGF